MSDLEAEINRLRNAGAGMLAALQMVERGLKRGVIEDQTLLVSKSPGERVAMPMSDVIRAAIAKAESRT